MVRSRAAARASSIVFLSPQVDTSHASAACVVRCGESVATGKWAGALVERLSFGRIYCRIQFYRDWRRNMLEKVRFVHEGAGGVRGGAKMEKRSLRAI